MLRKEERAQSPPPLAALWGGGGLGGSPPLPVLHSHGVGQKPQLALSCPGDPGNSCTLSYTCPLSSFVTCAGSEPGHVGWGALRVPSGPHVANGGWVPRLAAAIRTEHDVSGVLTVTKNILREHMFILVSRPPCGLFCLLLLFFTRLVWLRVSGVCGYNKS